MPATPDATGTAPVLAGPFRPGPRPSPGRQEESDRPAALAGLACASLGWSPDQFWAATPAELAAIVRAIGGERAAPADAGLLQRMKEAFPDG